jgi:hypothetical protein
MFDTRPGPHPSPDYLKASESAFAGLFKLIEECQAQGNLAPGRSLDRALLSWSLVHGIAKLAVTGRLNRTSYLGHVRGLCLLIS